MAKVTPINENMLDLLKKAKSGSLVIPDFQREFIWRIGQIEELLNSVVNEYFIGSILLLESSAINKRFAPKPIYGIGASSINYSEGGAIHYILDGQQRMTSLYYAFYEPDNPLSNEVNLKVRFFIRPDTDEVYGLVDPEYFIRKAKMGKDLAEQFYKTYKETYGIDPRKLPSMSVFRDRESMDRYLRENPTLSSSFKDRLDGIFNKIHEYQIPTITLPIETSDEDIVNTFERINRTGTPLGIFELAVARYYPSGINLNYLKKRLKKRTFLQIGNEVSVLKYMAISKDMEPKSQNLLKLVDDSIQDKVKRQILFHDDWDEAVRYLDKAAERMTRHYGSDKIKLGKREINLVPYTSMIIPLSIVLKEIDRKGSAENLYKKLDSWYWSTVFAQKYSHGTDTKAFQDVHDLVKWFGDPAAKPDYLPNFDSVKKEMLNAARSSALGKAFYVYLKLNECRDIFTGQPLSLSQVHVDHIFPHSKYGKTGDNIFNLTLLDKRTNQSRKQDKMPSEFLEECLSSHGEDLDSFLGTLKTHFIDEQGYMALKNNDFDSFIMARANYFIQTLKGVLN